MKTVVVPLLSVMEWTWAAGFAVFCITGKKRQGQRRLTVAWKRQGQWRFRCERQRLVNMSQPASVLKKRQPTEGVLL